MPSTFHGLSEAKVEPNTEISVHEAGRLKSTGDGQGFAKCRFKRGCVRKSCKCMRSSFYVIQGSITRAKISDEFLILILARMYIRP